MPRRSSKSGEEATPGLFDAPPPRSERSARPAHHPWREEEPERDAPVEPTVLTVSALTHAVAGRLQELGRVVVEGEVSSLRTPASGHVYFDLKDHAARISCVVWRSQARRILKTKLEEGTQVVVHGKLDVYAPRGSYSLIVDKLEPVGMGALLAKLEELKVELRDLGYFDRHRPLPALPRMVGVVTSRDGAALRDFLRTRTLRWPGYPVRLAHAPVQGPDAAPEIAGAIARLDASGVDVIVVCRGGGSLEDLWAFNERAVADAIRDASVPVVSGVGHESDVTLADLVADARAHTPTDAAQTVLPDRAALVAELERCGNWLVGAVHAVLEDASARVERLAARPALREPRRILGERGRILAGLATRAEYAARARATDADGRMRTALARLERWHPQVRLERWERRLGTAGAKLERRGAEGLAAADQRLRLAARSLEATSPLAVLGRGYSVTRRAGSKEAVRDAAELAAGDELESLLGKGTVRSRVEGVAPGDARSEDER